MVAAKQKSNAVISLVQNYTDIQASGLFNRGNEHALVGAVLYEPELYFRLADIVKASDFSDIMAAFIWHAFTELTAQGKQIDWLTVSETVPTLKGFTLSSDDVLEACTTMMTSVPNVDHVMDYAQRVADNATRLRILKAADDIRRIILDKTLSLDEQIQQTDTLSFEATRRSTAKPTDMATLASEYHDLIERGMQGQYVSLVPSGFQAMDSIAQGYRKGEVHVVAGGAGMGKSTWLLSQIRAMAKRIQAYNTEHDTSLRIIHFTMEMQARECIEKWVIQETAIPQWKLQRPLKMTTEERQRFTKAIGEISQLPIEVVDEYGSLRPVEMRTRIKRYMQEFDVCMVTVDGLWLMTPDAANKDTRVPEYQTVHQYLTMRIAGIAKDFDVPIILLHQYNQDSKNRANKRPMLSDMAWGQAVQQDFHTIWGMHRLRGADKADNPDDKSVTFYGLKGRSNTAIEGSTFQMMFDENRALYRDLNLGEINGGLS